MIRQLVLATALVAAAAATASAQPDRSAVNWPSFRGERARGMSGGPAAPTTWDVPAGRNVRWTTPVAGLGLSCPVVWADRIYLTTAVGEGEDRNLRVGLYGDIEPVNETIPYAWKVICIDRNTGKPIWERTAHQGVPKVKRHPKSSHANSTPATDGKHVVAFFGSEGLYCYDADGKLLWKKDLGLLDSGYFRAASAQWGFASSPVIHEDRVIVQCDVQKGSFIAAFSLNDGDELWRTPRQEVPTWSTPTIHSADGRTQLICNGWKEIAGYDAATGKRLWWMEGGGDIPVPTPVVAHDLIFITNAHGSQAPIYAIRTDAEGPITLAAVASPGNERPPAMNVAWSERRGGNYMQTPIVVGEHLFLCRDNGQITCYEAKTGRQLGRQKLGDGRAGFTASPVASGGHLYYTSEEGQVYVVGATPELPIVATNSLGDLSMATPAVSDGVIFFRTRSHLVAVGGERR